MSLMKITGGFKRGPSSHCSLEIQSTLAISNSDISNSAKLEASIWFKSTFWLLSSTIIWHLRLFYKSKLPEVQFNLHFGWFEIVKNSPHNFEISRVDCNFGDFQIYIDLKCQWTNWQILDYNLHIYFQI